MWIPCTEQLPDDDQTVLVHHPEHRSEPVWLGYHEDGQWYDIDGCPLRPTVTHWQPLPDPPVEAPPSHRSHRSDRSE